MIRFLLKGLFRDRSRSLFPLIIVSAGVFLTVGMQAWIGGMMTLMIQTSAHFNSGHLQVATKAYAGESDQAANDLAILGITPVLTELRQDYPDLLWTPRIRFGGILDIPDEQGETRSQATVGGLAVDLNDDSPEMGILSLREAIVGGQLPEAPGEILISDELARTLGVAPGGTATLMTTTMYGSMSVTNFTVAGTFSFGISAMDRGMILASLPDIQHALDMTDGAGEILGFFNDDLYHHERVAEVTTGFTADHGSDDPFSLTMRTFRDVSGLGEYLDLIGVFNVVIIGIFLFAMSLVLWNVGLTSGLRRYGEIGVRLAIGEEKGHVYRTMIAESVMLGIGGSVVGTAMGLAVAYYLQIHGIDIGSMMKGSTALLTNVVRAQVSPFTYVIGFIPGLLATVLGAGIAGIRIYQRQTAQLFKELET